MKKIYLATCLMAVLMLLNSFVVNAQQSANCPAGAKTYHIKGIAGVNSNNTLYLTGFIPGYTVQIYYSAINALNTGTIKADGTYTFVYPANTTTVPDIICISTTGIPCCIINVPALTTCSGAPNSSTEFGCLDGVCKIFTVVAAGAAVQLLDNNGNIIPNQQEVSRVKYAQDPTKDIVCVSYSKVAGKTVGSVVECGTAGCCTKPYTPGAALPVKWGAVSAALNNGNAKLNWNTVYEVGTRSFVIEKSTDGRNFTAVGSVNAVGLSDSKVSYSFTDNSLNVDAAFYRLKQVDIDGGFEYSKVVYVNGRKNTNAIAAIAPTVTVDGEFQVIGVSTSELTRNNIQIFNSAGQSVNYTINGANSISIGSNVAKGLYVVRFKGQNIKLLKQ